VRVRQTLGGMQDPVVVRVRNAVGAGIPGVTVTVFNLTGQQLLVDTTGPAGNSRFWSPNQTLFVQLSFGNTVIGRSANFTVPNVTQVTGVVNTTFTTP